MDIEPTCIGDWASIGPIKKNNFYNKNKIAFLLFILFDRSLKVTVGAGFPSRNPPAKIPGQPNKPTRPTK